MKTLYIIGGTMGVGKTAVSQQLKLDLPNSVLLAGDWCWDASPFQVTDETNLRKRLTKDVERGIRSENVIERSIARIPMYQALSTIKLNTNEKTVAMIANEIKQL